jgi:hypothetical protein
MKKLVIYTLIVLFNQAYSKSQDLIITEEGDSINCLINNIDNSFYYFTFKYNDEIRETIIPKEKVTATQYNFYDFSELPNHILARANGYSKKWMIRINGGYSYRVAKLHSDVPSNMVEYMKELKSGYHLSGDITYFISKGYGIGLKYSTFRASNELSNMFLIYDDGSHSRVGTISDDINISFYAPSIVFRLSNKKNTNDLVFTSSTGILHYKNEATAIDPYLITSFTLGYQIGLGYSIKTSEYMAIGFKVSYLGGTLVSLNIDDGSIVETVKLEPEYYESLSRLDFSVGFRFNF